VLVRKVPSRSRPLLLFEVVDRSETGRQSLRLSDAPAWRVRELRNSSLLAKTLFDFIVPGARARIVLRHVLCVLAVQAELARRGAPAFHQVGRGALAGRRPTPPVYDSLVHLFGAPFSLAIISDHGLDLSEFLVAGAELVDESFHGCRRVGALHGNDFEFFQVGALRFHVLRVPAWQRSAVLERCRDEPIDVGLRHRVSVRRIVNRVSRFLHQHLVALRVARLPFLELLGPDERGALTAADPLRGVRFHIRARHLVEGAPL
jgi:hypothetical protein